MVAAGTAVIDVSVLERIFATWYRFPFQPLSFPRNLKSDFIFLGFCQTGQYTIPLSHLPSVCHPAGAFLYRYKLERMDESLGATSPPAMPPSYWNRFRRRGRFYPLRTGAGMAAAWIRELWGFLSLCGAMGIMPSRSILMFPRPTATNLIPPRRFRRSKSPPPSILKQYFLIKKMPAGIFFYWYHIL